MQSLNYMKVDSLNKLNFPTEHTQIPFEILTGEENLRYRIYLNHIDDKIYNEIRERIINNRPMFPLYFGSAPFSCYIEYIDEYNYELKASDEYETITTAINAEKVAKIDIGSIGGTLVKERMTRNFGGKDESLRRLVLIFMRKKVIP